jgi:uncharacterized caspase-like protein
VAVTRVYRIALVSIALFPFAMLMPARGDEGRYTGVVRSVKSDVFTLDVTTKMVTRTVYLRFDPEKTTACNLIEPGERITVKFDTATHVATGVFRPSGDSPSERTVRLKPVARRTDSATTWVVLIGIERYRHRLLETLNYAVEDVDAIHDLYTKKGGLSEAQILRITDDTLLKPTHSVILRELETFFARVGPSDTLVLFYSGHGLLDPVGDPAGKGPEPRGYIAPSDCDPSGRETLERTGIPIDVLLSRMAECTAKHRVLLIDACHSGAIQSEQINVVFKKARGVVTLASCQSGEVSREDPELGNGIFTALVVDAFAGGADLNTDGLIECDELYNYVHAHSEGTGQTPVMFRPPTVVGQPVVLGLTGAAAELARAKQAAAQQNYEEAFETVRALGRLDDPRHEIERIDLADLCASKAVGVYRTKAGEQFDKVRASLNKADVLARRRVIRCALALASDDLGMGSKARFQVNIEAARQLLDGMTVPSLYVEDAVAIAEVMQQVQSAAGFDNLRAKYSEELGPLLIAADEKVRAIKEAQAQQETRALFAGACWRLAVDDLWKFYIGTVIEGYSADTMSKYLTLCEALSLARNPEGALQGAIEIDRLKALEPIEQPKAALAFALVARSAAQEVSRSAIRQNVTGVFAQAESKTLEILKLSGITASPDAGAAQPETSRTAQPATNLAAQPGTSPPTATAPPPPAVAKPLEPWQEQVVLILIQAYANMGRFGDAQKWTQRLLETGFPRGQAVAAIATAQARLGFPDEARASLRSIKLAGLPDRLDVCHAIAQAEAMGRQDRLNNLLDWIETPANGEAALMPEEKICAYAGVIDGLNKKPWTRLAINSPDGVHFRYNPNGNPVVVSNHTAGQARPMPDQPVFRPMANDARALQVAANLNGITDLFRGVSLGQAGQIGHSVGDFSHLGAAAELLRGHEIPGIHGIPHLGGLGGISGMHHGFR